MPNPASPSPTSPVSMELPEEIAEAIARLHHFAFVQGAFEQRPLRCPEADLDAQTARSALTAAILSRLREAEAGREEARAELHEALHGDEAQGVLEGLQIVVGARDAALARVERLEKRVNSALDDACRMSAILLMAGEMTAQERRTARAVAGGLATKVRTALTDPTHPAVKDETNEGAA